MYTREITLLQKWNALLRDFRKYCDKYHNSSPAYLKRRKEIAKEIKLNNAAIAELQKKEIAYAKQSER